MLRRHSVGPRISVSSRLGLILFAAAAESLLPSALLFDDSLRNRMVVVMGEGKGCWIEGLRPVSVFFAIMFFD